MPQVKFVNEKQTVEAEAGENLRQIALRNGIQIYKGPHTVVNCRGLGQCGSCNVVIKSGEGNCNKRGLWERFRVLVGPLLFWKSLSRGPDKLRLACRTKVNGDIEVETHPENNWHGDKFWS